MTFRSCHCNTCSNHLAISDFSLIQSFTPNFMLTKPEWSRLNQHHVKMLNIFLQTDKVGSGNIIAQVWWLTLHTQKPIYFVRQNRHSNTREHKMYSCILSKHVYIVEVMVYVIFISSNPNRDQYQSLSLYCLMIPSLKDIQCHVWPYSFSICKSPDQTSGHMESGPPAWWLQLAT